MFTPRLSMLPPPQLQLWRELCQIPGEFVLYGGTALALYFGHRQSVDFDFFSDKDFDPGRLGDSIPFLASATITQREPNTLCVLIDRGGPVKVSFFGLPRLKRLRPPQLAQENGLKIASLHDLAGTKAAVVQQRAEAKDYLDIDAILADGRVDLATAIASAKAIYGSAFNPLPTLKALSYFADGNLDTLPRETQDRLAKAARAVDLEHLPTIALSGEVAP